MNSLADYVRFIAESMGVFLTDEQIITVTNKLATSDKYKESLHELEEMIFFERNRRRIRWKKK